MSLPLSCIALLQDLTAQAPPNAPPSDGLRWIDLVGLGLVGLFAVLGLLRGLWWQVFRLVAVGAAVAAARVATPPLVEWALGALPGVGRTVLTGVSWVLVFVLVLLVAGLVGKLGKRSLEAVQLSALDRVGGLVAGALTGAALHFVLVLALEHLTPHAFSSELLAGTWSRSLYGEVAAEPKPAYAADESAPARAAPVAPPQPR